MKKISVVTPCYNEEENVEELYRVIKRIMEGLGNYDYEHIYICLLYTSPSPRD